MEKKPRDWCDPPSAFGQLTEGNTKKRVSKRHWTPPLIADAHATAAFRSAVMQNVICLYVRQSKNSLPHPRLPGQTLPLEVFAQRDARSARSNFWQEKLTGLTAITAADIVTLMEILPGSLPPESVVKEFLDVAQKRMRPVPGWEWPDT